MKEAIRRYLLGMHRGLCLGVILTVGVSLALNWTFRAAWMALDFEHTPVDWLLRLFPGHKLAVLAAYPSLVGLVVVGMAVSLMLRGSRTIRAVDRPWTVVYGSTFFFILVQALCLGWMSAFWLVWPVPESLPLAADPTPAPSASAAQATASPGPLAGSSTPAASPNPFGEPPATPGPAPSEPAAAGSKVAFFDGLTLTVEQEVDLGRPSTAAQFGCREGVLYWCDGRYLTAVTLDSGTTRWRQEVGDELEVVAVLAQVVLTRGAAGLVAHQTGDGRALWERAGPLLVDGDRLFSLSEGKLLEVDPASGQAAGAPVTLSAAVEDPQVADGVVVGRARNPDRISVLDAATGSQLWWADRKSQYQARDGRLYLRDGEATTVRELRTGKPLAGGKSLPGELLASTSGSVVMRRADHQEVDAYDPSTGTTQWSSQQVLGWPLSGREGVLLLRNEGGGPLLLALDGSGAQLFKGPLDPSMGVRGVVGARENQVVLLLDQ